MARIGFHDIRFRKIKGNTSAVFQDMFYFDLDDDKLGYIGEFELIDGDIEFAGISHKKAEKKLNMLINNGFSRLKSIMTGKRAVYIHKNSGIPLLGSQYFGIIDRNTSIIELRPNTGCNLSCIYCSIDEGRNSRRLTDYSVEQDYIVQELKGLVKNKGCNDLEVYINPQGEPLIYKPIVELVRGISEIPQIKRISINTNGIALTKKLIDSLTDSGLTLLIISLNSLDDKNADRIAGCNYNVSHVLDMIEHAKTRLEVHIAPVYLPGINDDDIEALIRYCKKNDMKIYIQNFLIYKHGRRPIKPIKIEEFYNRLCFWEEEFEIKLRVQAEDLDVRKTKSLENPFKKGEKISALIKCPGRLRGEVLAVARDRVIQVSGCRKISGKVSVIITRTKHNIIKGIEKN